MMNLLEFIAGTPQVVFLDTETTGLYWHQGNLPFLLILADQICEPIIIDLEKITKQEYTALKEFLTNPKLTVVAHNAKFDAHMLENIGLKIAGTIYDTMTMHRHFVNNLLQYNLGALTGTKDKLLKEWQKKNAKLAKEKDLSGKYVPLYFKIPEEILIPYAIQDVICLRDLYNFQQKELLELHENKLSYAYHIDLACLKTVYQMERLGIKLDVSYACEASQWCKEQAEKSRARFKILTGKEFVDSGKSLSPILEAFGAEIPKTEKGNPQITKEFLLGLANDNAPAGKLAKIIVEIREIEKEDSTYYSNYLRLRGRDNRIHSNFNLFGADTGRMSSREPNMQNSSVEDEDAPPALYTPRACFVPDQDCYLVSIDFKAQEMRCIIDSAGETELAQRIIAGEDVHDATADLMGVKRKQAKTVGFGIIYGSGLATLAAQIKTSLDMAKHLKQLYFARLPKVKSVSQSIMREAELNGYIYTRYGNRLLIDKGFEYKAVNYYVQGSCAMHTKNAAIRVAEFLKKNKYLSRILLIIHDEILYEIFIKEMHIIPQIQKIMEDSYPHIILPMGTSVDIYKRRWGKEE